MQFMIFKITGFPLLTLKLSAFCVEVYYINIYIYILHIYISIVHTVCPRSSDPFYIVSCYIKWGTTSWTHSMYIYIFRAHFLTISLSLKCISTLQPKLLYSQGMLMYVIAWKVENLLKRTQKKFPKTSGILIILGKTNLAIN